MSWRLQALINNRFERFTYLKPPALLGDIYYRSVNDFLADTEFDEHTRYFKVESVSIAPLPSP